MKRLILPLAFALIASTSCKKKDEAPTDADASSNVPALEADAAEAAGVAPDADTEEADAGAGAGAAINPSEFSFRSELAVRDTGRAPRYDLRFDLENMQFGSYTIRTATSTQMGGVSIDPPPMIMPVTMELVERRADALRILMKTGDVRFDVDPSNPMHEPLAQQMTATLQAGQPDASFDLHADGSSSNFEVHGEAENELDAAVREAIQSSVSQITAQLPQEPVGVGAQWAIVQSIDVGLGQPVTITLVYSVRAIERGRAELDVRIDKSDLSLEVAEGTTVTMTLEGEGSTTFVSTSPIAEATLQMRMEMDTGDPNMGRAQSTISTTVHAD